VITIAIPPCSSAVLSYHVVAVVRGRWPPPPPASGACRRPDRCRSGGGRSSRRCDHDRDDVGRTRRRRRPRRPLVRRARWPAVVSQTADPAAAASDRVHHRSLPRLMLLTGRTSQRDQHFPDRVRWEMGADPCPQTETGPTPPGCQLGRRWRCRKVRFESGYYTYNIFYTLIIIVVVVIVYFTRLTSVVMSWWRDHRHAEV